MDTYINKIRDLLIDSMPKHWYKIYLFFECYGKGGSTGCYYIKTPGGSIVHYGEFIYNFADINGERIKQGMNEILSNVILLHESSPKKWSWGTMYISRDDYIPHCEFYDDPVNDEYSEQNRYKWVYENFGLLARSYEFEPEVYKKMLEGPRGILLLEDMESDIMAKNFADIDKAFRLENSTLEDELKTYYDAIAQHIYKLTPLHWGHARLYFKSHENISTVNLSIFKDKEDTCIH